MAAFAYKAVDSAGKDHRGVIEAANQSGARQALRDLNLLPTSVEPTREGAAQSGAAMDIGRLFRKRVGSKTLAGVTRQLSTLLGSDIRIDEALRIVARQGVPNLAAEVLLNVRASILDGRSFASALAEHPDAFPEFYRATIAAGEASGRLAEVMGHLTAFVENRQRVNQKVQLALLYPALLAAVSFLIIVLLLIYVVPNIVEVFVSRGADLPFLTRALIAISNGAQHYGLVALLAAIIAAVIGRQWLAKPINRLAAARLLAIRPPLGRFTRQLNAARFAGSLATLVRSDVPLVEALVASATVTPNLYIRARAFDAAARVREGASLHQAMTEGEVFPQMLLAIVASGEASGSLGISLERASQDLDRELETLTAALVALVEPAVVLIMGGVVLLLMLAILMPIVNLNNLAGAA